MGLSARARDALLALALAMLASLYTAGGADTHAKQAAELPLATHTHVVPRATPARLAALSKGAAHAFPANISGSYVGSWSLEPPRAPLELRLGGADDESKSGGGAKGRKGQRAVEQPRITPFPRGTSGAVLLQLRAAAARGGVRGVDDVLGEMVVRDGEYLSDRDVHLALAGAYVPALGQLRAVVARPLPGRAGPDTSKGEQPAGVLLTPGGEPKGGEAALVAGLARRAAAEKALGAERKEKKKMPRSAGGHDAGATPLSECPMTLVAQFKRVDADSGHEGKGKQKEPVLLIESAVLSSEACGLTAELTAERTQLKDYHARALRYAMAVLCASFVQVSLLIRQMAQTAAPSAAARVSLLTVGALAVLDAYETLLHLTIGIVVEPLLGTFGGVAFLKFATFSVLEMRYMLNIWKARRPNGFDIFDTQARRDLGMLYLRFYGALVGGLIVFFHEQTYARHALVVVNSFWLPQIVWSAYSDSRRPLLLEFIIGTSVTRLVAPVLIFGFKDNFLSMRPSISLVAVLVGWVGLQAGVLVSQRAFGPRWFVPKRFLPQRYDYARNADQKILQQAAEEDEEGGGGKDMTAASEEGGGGSPTGKAGGRSPVGGQAVSAKDRKAPMLDCAICFLPVDLRDRRIGRSIDRVITPCDHVFHEACLQKWMDVKQECPVCRRSIPPL